MSKNKVEVWVRVCGDGDIPSDAGEQRIRLIWPDGKAEWGSDTVGFDGCSEESLYPCWHRSSIKTREQAITAMMRYDKQNGYKTVKIGEV